jgi:rubrerythrin
MDMVALLDRCAGLERKASDFYGVLARRFPHDPGLTKLWGAMAAEEREHARKLATWRELIAAEPSEHRPQASGFEHDVDAVEHLLDESRVAAETADEEEAFALALGLEASEIDTIYTTLLQASPLARFPDFQETVRRESIGHHHALLEEAERRCRSERSRLRMALLAAHDH